MGYTIAISKSFKIELIMNDRPMLLNCQVTDLVDPLELLLGNSWNPTRTRLLHPQGPQQSAQSSL